MDRILGVRTAATATVQTVGVGWRLSVTEVAAVAAPPDTPGYSALLYSLAYHHTVLLELLGEDGVEEWVAAGVQWENKDSENLGSFQGYQMETAGCTGCEESDRKPADEVSEY